MNWNQIEGNWKQIKGKVIERWGLLTEDDMNVVAGKREQLEGRLQERYGYTTEKVRDEVDDFCLTCKMEEKKSEAK